MAALIGSILIYPVLRTRGHYAAVVTIAFALLFKSFLEVNDVLGGPQGLAVANIDLFGWDFGVGLGRSRRPSSSTTCCSRCSVALGMLWLSGWSAPGSGSTWTRSGSTRRRPRASASTSRAGRSPRSRSAIFCGNGGGALGMMLAFIAPNNFTFADGLIMVSIVLLGGIGNPWGVVVAAVRS